MLPSYWTTPKAGLELSHGARPGAATETGHTDGAMHEQGKISEGVHFSYGRISLGKGGICTPRYFSFSCGCICTSRHDIPSPLHAIQEEQK